MMSELEDIWHRTPEDRHSDELAEAYRRGRAEAFEEAAEAIDLLRQPSVSGEFDAASARAWNGVLDSAEAAIRALAKEPKK